MLRTAQQQPKHWCVINAVLVTNPKHTGCCEETQLHLGPTTVLLNLNSENKLSPNELSIAESNILLFPFSIKNPYNKKFLCFLILILYAE